MQNVAIDRLKGRENFSIWKTQAKSFLIVNALWKYVENSLFASASTDEIEKEQQALGQLILLLDPCTFSHIATATTAKEA